MHARLVTIAFLVLIVGVPIGQAVTEHLDGRAIGALAVAGSLDAERLRNYERGLERESILRTHVVPYYQELLLETFDRGNEQVVVGTEGSLLLSADMDYVTRSDHDPEAVGVIADFARQLWERGVGLVLVPIPPKPRIDRFRVDGGESLDRTTGLRRQEHRFYRGLERAGVAYVDVIKHLELHALEQGRAYLETDTHWTPGAMQDVADEVASYVELFHTDDRKRRIASRSNTAVAEGDLVELLSLPSRPRPVFEAAPIQLRVVLDRQRGRPIVHDRSSRVLLLGDSFTRAFSDRKLGLGEHAGLAEQLALTLDEPLDVIAIPGGSATAVRETLARRADALVGKRLVVWQISMRDLIDERDLWQPVELPESSDVTVEPAGQSSASAVVRAEIVETSRVPAAFNYEFCLAI